VTGDAVDGNRKAKAALIAALLFNKDMDGADADEMDQTGRDAAAQLCGKGTPSDETWAHVVRILDGLHRVFAVNPYPEGWVACPNCGTRAFWDQLPCWTCRRNANAGREDRALRQRIIKAVAGCVEWPSAPASDAEFTEAGR
jgi:hypothetical protein